VVVEAVEKAFELAEAEPRCLVLLGARPTGPEVEYGWIELGDPIAFRAGAHRVRSFYEKPSGELAGLLLRRQALWNTFVMVGPVLTFLEAICSAAPGLVGVLRQSAMPRAPSGEIRLEESAYAQIPPVDFSRQVLSAAPDRLIVQRLGPVVWNDLGDCSRAVDALLRAGFEPDWVKRWRTVGAAVSAVA
jgi:mannose-1-phosphate guanylyltransferase